jgi:hypothetical protein
MNAERQKIIDLRAQGFVDGKAAAPRLNQMEPITTPDHGNPEWNMAYRDGYLEAVIEYNCRPDQPAVVRHYDDWGGYTYPDVEFPLT